MNTIPQPYPAIQTNPNNIQQTQTITAKLTQSKQPERPSNQVQTSTHKQANTKSATPKPQN